MLFKILFWVLFISVFGRLIFFSVKACWKIFKVLFVVVFLPLLLIAVFIKGLIYLSLAGVLIVGIISLLAVRK